MKNDLNKTEQTKEHILIYAIQEFAFKGYDKASTNMISENAKVAKGLIFHHFSNKQTLYLSCLEKVFKEMQQLLDKFIQQMPYDLFTRLEEFLKWKYEYTQNHQINFRFILNITKTPLDIRKKAEDIIYALRMQNRLLLENYDQTLWKNNINQKDALAVLVLLFEAIDQKTLQQMDILDSLNESDLNHTILSQDTLDYALRMLSVLKTAFYNE